MWLKFLRGTGLFFIVIASALSVAAFQFQREIQNSGLSEATKSFLSYPSYFEDRFYDFRMLLTLNKEEDYTSKELVLAAIDDQSLKDIGRFPWSRKTWSPIIKRLEHFGAKVLAFDVVFSEAERAIASENPDQVLADAVSEFQANGGSVIIPYSLTSMHPAEDDISFKEAPGDLFNFMMDTKQASEVGLTQFRVMSASYPIDTLLASTPFLSYIGANEDPDGVFRKYPLLANVDSLYFPSYSLQTYQLLTGDKALVEIGSMGEAKLKLKEGTIGLNFRGESKIRWLGDSYAFPTVGISRILQAKDDDLEMKKLLNGKAVFIGSTAFAAHDLRHTPVDPKLPGVYFHMNMTQMLLDGLFFKSAESSLLWSWGILVIGSLLMFIITLFQRPVVDLVFMIAVVGGLFAVDTYYLLPEGHEITLFFSLLPVFGTYSWQTFFNFYSANQDKAFLKEAFGNYISPELIDEMYESGEPPKLGGDCGVRTAYFTDIQSFSTFSEKLSPTELVELLNEYLSVMTDILLEERGTLDKYEGDAIIAFFGAPLPLEDHAARSCRVACKMQDALLDLRKKWVSEGDKWPQIVHEMRMRIGINTGEIVTGNMGSKVRMNYTMMGDSVNLAARLEEAAKQYGIFTQTSQYTKDEAGDEEFLWRELDTILVVGKSEPVTTFDLMGLKSDADENLVKLREVFHEGLALYKAQEWDKALECFNQSLELEYIRFPLLKGKKTNPSEVYIERCNAFKENPPEENWDGVYTLTSK